MYTLPPPSECARRQSEGTVRAREELRSRLGELASGEVLAVSLRGDDYDFSPLDEIVVSGALMDIAIGRLLGRYMYLIGVSPYTEQELGYVLMIRGKRPPLAVLVANEGEEVRVVGKLGAKTLATFEWLGGRGQATASQLSDGFGIGLTAANNRLADLHAVGLVTRTDKEATRGAREYVYRPIV